MDMKQNSDLGYFPSFIGGVTFIALIIFMYSHLDQKLDKIYEKLERSKLEIQTRDLNNNGISDKFYVIDNKVAVVELDGKPVISSLEKQLLEKE